MLLCSAPLGRLHARFLLRLNEGSPPNSGSKDLFRRYESRRVAASGRVENDSCLLLGTEIIWGPLEAEFSRKSISRVRIGWISIPEFSCCDWLCAQGLVGFPAQGLDDFKLSTRSGVECEFLL